WGRLNSAAVMPSSRHQRCPSAQPRSPLSTTETQTSPRVQLRLSRQCTRTGSTSESAFWVPQESLGFIASCCKAITRNIKGAHFAVSCDCWRSPLTERGAVMNQEKYIGMDVHQATISVAVMDSSGKLIMECILETKAATILEFIAGLRGTLSV